MNLWRRLLRKLAEEDGYVVLAHVATGDLATAALQNDLLDDVAILKTSINDDGSLKTGLDTSTAEVDIVNTSTADQVAYTYSITGGNLPANRAIQGELKGSYLNNAGLGNSTLNVKVTYGGVTLFENNAVTPTPSANRTPVILRFTISSNGATNSQRAVGEFLLGDPTSPETSWKALLIHYSAMKTGLTVDSTVAQTLSILITHQRADLLVSFKKYSVTLERVGA